MNRKNLVKMMICLTLVSGIAATIQTKVSAEKNPGHVTYTVQEGDCLDSIAARYIDKDYRLDKNTAIYKLRTRIMIANNLQAMTIYPGEKIVIPGGIQSEK